MQAPPKYTKSASSLTSQSRDSHNPDGRNSWLNGDARPSRSAQPATTPSTPVSQPRHPRRNHRRATCAERRTRWFGRRALEKDHPSRHLAGVLPHSLLEQRAILGRLLELAWAGDFLATSWGEVCYGGPISGLWTTAPAAALWVPSAPAVRFGPPSRLSGSAIQ